MQHDPLAAFAKIVFQFHDQGHVGTRNRHCWPKCNSFRRVSKRERISE